MTIHQPAIAIIAAALLGASFAVSAPAAAKPAQAKKSAPSQTGAKLLMDAWFTITLNPGGTGAPVHYGYYNDHVESREGKLYFQNRVWKLEQGFVNEEQLGAMAQDDPDLTPLMYNFHSNYRASETMIDGTFQDGKLLTIKVRKGQEEMPVFRRSIPSKTILEVFFPVWLGRHMASFQPGKSVPFSTVLEDSVDTQFETIGGRLQVEKADSFANQSKTTKVSVDFKGVKTIWWVDPSGVAKRIENPGAGQVVERVEKAKAEAFLSGQPTAPPSSTEDTDE